MISSEYDELDAALDTRAAAGQPAVEAEQTAAAAVPADAVEQPAAPVAAEAEQAAADEQSAAPQTPPSAEEEPVVTEPVETKPAEAEPVVTEPVVTEPTETKPAEAENAPKPDAVPAAGDGASPTESAEKPENADKPDKKRKKKKKKEQIEPETEQTPGDPKKKRKKPKRKGRFITPLIILGILIGIAAACLWNIWYCQNNFEVNFYQVESTHVNTNVRIVVISDVHLSEYGEDNKELVEAVRALEPDLIISAGDLVTYGVSDYENMLSLCRQLVEIAPTYGVMGNHEDEKTYLEHDEQLRQRFKDTGMILLINKCERLKIRNNDIELVGVSGGTEGFDLYGGKDTMEKLEENPNVLRICIAHVPTLFKERLEDYDFDIGIAGHTHGGVVRLPMIGGLYSAEEGFRPQFDGGLYTLDNDATLFVSRGLGNSGKIPRFYNTPELAVLDVRWY